MQLIAPGIVHAQQPLSSGAPSTPAGWQLIESYAASDPAGESLIDFLALPADFATLVVIGDSVVCLNDTTRFGHRLSCEANEWDGSDYLGMSHVVQSVGSGTTHVASTSGNQSWEVGTATWVLVGGVASFVAWFPGYAVPGTFKNMQSQSMYGYGNGRSMQQTSSFARLNLARSDVIDHLRFFTGAWSGSPSNLFVPPTRMTVYGVALP